MSFGQSIVLYVYLFYFAIFFLHGCSADILKDTGSILEELGTTDKEEKEAKEASTFEMMVYAQDQINLNSDNEPTPITFIVVELTNDTRLNLSDYESLSGDIKKALGETYLNHEEYIVEPGKFVHIDDYPIKKRARHLAVISAYRAIDHTIWRAIVDIEDKGQKYSIHTALKLNEVSMELQ